MCLTSVVVSMSEITKIPIFPLNILPLPEELIPLHIFEQKYRQLLVDVERNDIEFGIFYAVPKNDDRVGSIVRLESILKRYDTGESDIVVRCVDTFLMSRYYKNFKDKLYAGGEVISLQSNIDYEISEELLAQYNCLRSKINPNYNEDIFSVHEIANSLDLDNNDRLKYVRILSMKKKERFLKERLKYKQYIIDQEHKYKNSFTLN